MLQEVIDGLVVGGVTYRWMEPDTVPPEVVAHSPLDSAQDVALDTPIAITFTEKIGPLTFDLSLTPAVDPAGWDVVWNEAGTVVTVTHGGLAAGQTYTAEVTAGDAWANPMATSQSWSFTTIEGRQIYLPVVVRNR